MGWQQPHRPTVWQREPLCSAQPLQLYWDALHEALSELGPFQAQIVSPSMSLIIFKPHCSFWIYSQICQALSCLWPLPILFPLPGRVFARLMPPTSDLLNITSPTNKKFFYSTDHSQVGKLIFIPRRMSYTLYIPQNSCSSLRFSLLKTLVCVSHHALLEILFWKYKYLGKI